MASLLFIGALIDGVANASMRVPVSGEPGSVQIRDDRWDTYSSDEDAVYPNIVVKGDLAIRDCEINLLPATAITFSQFGGTNVVVREQILWDVEGRRRRRLLAQACALQIDEDMKFRVVLPHISLLIVVVLTNFFSVVNSSTAYAVSLSCESIFQLPKSLAHIPNEIRLPTLKEPLENEFSIERPGGNYDKLLTDSERATIFLNLVDRSDMLAGGLINALLSWEGVIDPEHRFGRVRTAIGVQGVRYVDGFDRHATSFIVDDHGERKTEGPAFLYRLLVEASKNPSKPLHLKLPVTREFRGYRSRDIADVVVQTRIPDLQHLRPFFKWVEANSARAAYAVWVIEKLDYNADVFQNAVAAAGALAMTDAASLARSGQPNGVVRSIFSFRRRRAVNKLKNLKLHFGFAIGALKEVQNFVDPEASYKSLRPSLDEKYAVAMFNLGGFDFAIQDDNDFYESLRALQLTVTGVLSDTSEINARMALFLTAADQMLKKIGESQQFIPYERRTEALAWLNQTNNDLLQLRQDQIRSQTLFEKLTQRVSVFEATISATNQTADVSQALSYLSKLKILMQKAQENNFQIEQTRIAIDDQFQRVLNTVLKSSR